MTEFKLWLEFEDIDPGTWNKKNDFTNVQVDLSDGRKYGINVWTYNYLKTSIEEDKKSGNNLNGQYQTPPDLFVNELTRSCIEKTIQDLLKEGELENLLNPTIIIND